MIGRLIEAIESLNKRMTAVERVMPSLCEKISRIHDVVAEPDGYVTFSGSTHTTKDHLKKAMESTTMMEMERVNLEVRFSEAIYLGAKLKHNPDMVNTLSDAAISQIRKALDTSQEILRIAHQIKSDEAAIRQLVLDATAKMNEDQSEALVKAATKLVAESAEEELRDFKDALHQHIGEGAIALDMTAEQARQKIRGTAAAEKSEIDGSLEELQKQYALVENAREGLESAVSEAKSERSTTRRETKVKNRNTSVASIRMK